MFLITLHMLISKRRVLPLPVGAVINELSSLLYNKSKHCSCTWLSLGCLITKFKGNECSDDDILA